MFSHNTGWHSWLTRSRFGKPCSRRDLVHWQPRCGFHPTTEVEERYKGCSLIDPILIPPRFSQSVNVGVLNHAGLLSQLLDVGQLGISGPRIRPAGAGGARRATPTPPGRPPPPVCGSPSLGASSPTLRARRRRKPPRACRRDPGPYLFYFAGVRPQQRYPRSTRDQPEDHDSQVADNAKEEERPAGPAQQAQGVQPLGEGDNQEERSVTPPLLEMFWHHPQMNDRRQQGEGGSHMQGPVRPPDRAAACAHLPRSLPPWSHGLTDERAGRCADGTDTGLVWPEHRQERVGQDYGGRHQRYVKAVLDVEESLHIGAGMDVHIVVGPPGDKEPADREVRDPRPPRRAAQSPLQWCESEEQEGDTETERQRLEGSEEEEEGKLSRGGLGADLGGGPDDGTQHHGRSRDEYGNGQHFHPRFHCECPPFAGRGDWLASESCMFTRSP